MPTLYIISFTDIFEESNKRAATEKRYRLINSLGDSVVTAFSFR